MTRIRFAREDDLAVCTKFDHTVTSRSVLGAKVRAKEVLLALSEQAEPVGYLRLEYLWSRIPYIGLILIKEEMRGMGIGGEVLEFLETYLRGRGFKTLMSSSQVDEPRAQHWHRVSGFEQCGIISGINDSGVGEVFFRKSLIT